MSVEQLPPAAETTLTSLDCVLIDLNEAIAHAVEPLKEEFQQVAEATLQASPPHQRAHNALCLEVVAWPLFSRYGATPPSLSTNKDGIKSSVGAADIRLLSGVGLPEFYYRCNNALQQVDFVSHFRKLLPETAVGQLLAACMTPSPDQAKEQLLGPMPKASASGDISRRETASGLAPTSPQRRLLFARQRALLETQTEIAPGSPRKPTNPLQQARDIINASYMTRDPNQAGGFKGFRFNPDDPFDPKLERTWVHDRAARAFYQDAMGHDPLSYGLEKNILNALFSDDCKTIEEAIEQGVQEAAKVLVEHLTGGPYGDILHDLLTIKGARAHTGGRRPSFLPSEIGARSREEYQRDASKAIGWVVSKPWRGGFATRLVQFDNEVPASALTNSHEADARLRLLPQDMRTPRIAGYTLVKTALGNRYRFRYDGKESDPHRPCTVELPVEGREKMAEMLRDINMKRLADLLDPARNRRPVTVDDLEAYLKINTRYLKPQKNSSSEQIRGGENTAPLENLQPYAHLVTKKGKIEVQCEGSATFLGDLVQTAFGDKVSVRVRAGKPFGPLSLILREQDHAQLEIAFADQAPYIKDATGESMILLHPRSLLRLAASVIRLAATRKPKKDDVLPSLRVAQEKLEYKTVPVPKEDPGVVWQRACTNLSGVLGITDETELIAAIGARPRRDLTRIAFDAIYHATHATTPTTLAAARIQLQEATEAIIAVQESAGQPAALSNLLLRLLGQTKQATTMN